MFDIDYAVCVTEEMRRTAMNEKSDYMRDKFNHLLCHFMAKEISNDDMYIDDLSRCISVKTFLDKDKFIGLSISVKTKDSELSSVITEYLFDEIYSSKVEIDIYGSNMRAIYFVGEESFVFVNSEDNTKTNPLPNKCIEFMNLIHDIAENYFNH